MVNYEVKTEQYGFVHYYGQCQSCDWDKGICSVTTREDVRQGVRKHVANTGHSVVISAGKDTLYKAK